MMVSATPNNSTSPSSSSSMSDNHGKPTPPVAESPRRPSRHVSSPWTQIVRGESEPIASAAEAPIDHTVSPSVAPPTASSLLTVAAAAEDKKQEESGGQGNAGKKPVWKNPSNGAPEVGPVMGASSWPALSETTKAPSNKPSSSCSSSDPLKSPIDVTSSSSVSVSQGISNGSVPHAPRQVGRANPNPTPNQNTRQRSFNKRNGASGAANVPVSEPSAQGSYAEFPLHNPSPRGHNQKNGFASHSQGGSNDNPSQRELYRNQNGNHHQNHGGRRNQDHGNQNWTSQRSFNGRDGSVQSQRGTPSFARHAPPPVQPIPPQFMAAQPIPPFGSPVPFPPELASPYYQPMPFIAPMASPPFFYHVQDAPLTIKLQKQIHYYFSEENLISDIYLRGFMDDQGFVPLVVIAGFKKVAELTDSFQQIVDSLQGSPFVEVQADKIRKRQNWQTWILPKVRADAVASRVGNLSLEQNSPDTGGSSGQLPPGEGDGNHNNFDGANR